MPKLRQVQTCSNRQFISTNQKAALFGESIKSQTRCDFEHFTMAYLCEICGCRFTEKRSLKRHNKHIHEKVKFIVIECSHLILKSSFLKNPINETFFLGLWAKTLKNLSETSLDVTLKNFGNVVKTALHVCRRLFGKNVLRKMCIIFFGHRESFWTLFQNCHVRVQRKIVSTKDYLSQILAFWEEKIQISSKK